jgi:hypothetical protein
VLVAVISYGLWAAVAAESARTVCLCQSQKVSIRGWRRFRFSGSPDHNRGGPRNTLANSNERAVQGVSHLERIRTPGIPVSDCSHQISAGGAIGRASSAEDSGRNQDRSEMHAPANGRNERRNV